MFAYCLKCKKQQEMSNGKEKITKNGRKMLTGKCKVCETTMNKFVSTKPATK